MGLSGIPHSEDAIQVTQHVANFFVRKSMNRPPACKVLDNLIYNYSSTYCGKAGKGYVEGGISQPSKASHPGSQGGVIFHFSSSTNSDSFKKSIHGDMRNLCTEVLRHPYAGDKFLCFCIQRLIMLLRDACCYVWLTSVLLQNCEEAARSGCSSTRWPASKRAAATAYFGMTAKSSRDQTPSLLSSGKLDYECLCKPTKDLKN